MREKFVFDALKKHQCESIIVLSDINRKWLFRGYENDFGIFIFYKNKVTCFVDEREYDFIKNKFSQWKTILYRSNADIFAFFKKNNIKSVGFEWNLISHKQYQDLIQPLKIKEINIDGNDLRIIKDQDELACLRKSADIICDAVTHMKKFIKVGMTELQAQDELFKFILKKGATGFSFPPIISFGSHSAEIHSIASDRKLKTNDIILLDCGCIYQGYCSDITRVWWAGKPDREQWITYQLVLEANEEGIKLVKKGVDPRIIDQRCREVISLGCGGYDIPHGIGHGIGLIPHENPRINRVYEASLQSNQVVTVEPGVYKKGSFGIRVEDTIVITDKGCEVLTAKAEK